MRKREKWFCLYLVLMIFFPLFSYSQCLIPSPEGDTLTPVINRMITPLPWGSTNEDLRRSIYKSVNVGSKIYVGGDFQYIGPNTGTGVVMNEEGTQISTFKKWRINGPVYSSVPDGIGGYYIVGLFTRVGDSTRNNIAHINSEGIPTSWYPTVNDYVTSIVLYSDTLIIGGKFTSVNGQARYAFAMLNKNTGAVLPWTFANNALQSGTLIHTFKLVDTFLYVGGKYNLYNLVGSIFKINVKTGGASNFPAIFQMEDVYAVELNENKRKLYIGGHYGGTTPVANGFCIDLNTNAQLFKINVGMQNVADVGTIFSLRSHGRNVYVGGYFNFGSINGNGFNQKGIVVFDTATGQIRNFLNNCNGLISSIHAKGNKIYLGGEFTSIAGINRTNFAIFDTTLLSVANNTLSFSDKIRTVSFSETQMFIGGFFQSINCVARNGLASFDLNTGEINSWAPNFPINSLWDMKAKGDTIFLAGNFYNSGNGFVAVSGTTGTLIKAQIVGTCYNMLLDGDNIYVSGRDYFNGNPFLVKFNIPTLNPVNTWNPRPTFFIKSIQKRNGKIYGVGDLYDNNIRKGFLTEINEATGAIIRTIDFTPPPAGNNDFSWVSAGVMAGSRFFFTGAFNRLANSTRHDFAAFDVDTWQVSPIEVKIDGSRSDLQFKNGNLYMSGTFYAINDKPHSFFAVIDTTVGAVFPDKLKFNNDTPNGYNIDDYYPELNTFLVTNNDLIVGGSFRNVDKGMFPSLAKLKLIPGSAPSLPQGIIGPDIINCPSQNNIYSILNPNPDNRYVWFTSGQDITIKNNGTDSIKIDVGPLAVPGVLKAIAITECGRSDTVFKSFDLNTLEPTINASNIILVRKTDTTASIRFTKGNGARRIVVIRAASPIVDMPQDHQEYNADNNFGAGSNLGNNTYVVYKGDADSVNLKQLIPATTYYVTVFEFNGSGVNTNYLTTSNPSLSFTTLAVLPSIQASNIVITNVTQTSLTINCTPGNGSGRLVVMRIYTNPQISPVNATAYTASTAFGSGSDLGSGNYVVSVTNTPVTVTNLTPNTYYVITVFEFNGSGQTINYLTTGVPSFPVRTMVPEPTIQANNIVVSNINSSSCTINCTPGNGTYRLVVMRKSQPVIFVPQDSTDYPFQSSNAVFGHVFYQLGDSTTGLNLSTPVNVSNLDPNSIYHVAIFELNGFPGWSNSNYLTTSVPTASFTTSNNNPTVQASNLVVSSVGSSSATLTCNSGNGSRRLFVIRAGSPVVDNPVNGIEYPINNFYGIGSGNIGNYTFAFSYFSPANIMGLAPGTTYYVKVFECNGSGSTMNYMLAGAPSTSFTTNGTFTAEPTQQATNISVTSISGTSATINCTPGNGQNRIVIIRQSTSITSIPIDGQSYNASTIFGSGSSLGSQTYVISNTSVPVTVTGLTPNLNYTVKIFEFNGSGTGSNYLLNGGPVTTFSTIGGPPVEPTQQATNISVSSISSSSAIINCTAGNGQNRLVVIRQATSLSTTPVDGTSYTANTVFGSGSDTGTQTFVISNTTTPITVTGLSSETDYTVSVFEFNGSGAQTNYLTTGNVTSTFRTLANEPGLQATNIIVSSITSTTATINCTAGNGQNRLVVIRQSTSISATPVDATSYTANTIFGSGSDIGTQTFVIANTTTPVTVTGLSPNMNYAVSIFEFNGTSTTINYLTAGALQTSFVTSAAPTSEPTQQASNITISSISPTSAIVNCTVGNGQNRLVVIRQATSLSATPADGTSYTANTIFGSGGDIGTQTFVISNTATPVTVTGLTAETDYTVSIFEFNSNGAQTNYLTSANPASTFKTLAAEPGQQATNITVSSVSPTSAMINCTNGSGQNRLVVIRQATSLSSIPADGTSYMANTIFGNGGNIGTQTFVISNTSTPITVTGLTAETDYIVSIFEFNGSAATANYLTSANPTSTFRTLATEPTIASTNIVISNITSTGATINCTPGNGSNKLIVIKQGVSISVNPADGTNYASNIIFGNGANIGDQTFVLSNSSAPITVTGLQPQTDYTIKIFEYNGSGSSSNYLLSNAPATTFRTEIVTGVINLDLPGTSLKVFPNPIINDNIDLIFKTPKRGTLFVNISSISGSILLTKSFTITNNTTNLDIQLPANIIRGSFIIKCSFLGKDGSLIMVKM